jgi:hypothetical protein
MTYTALSFPDEHILEVLERGVYGSLFRKHARPVCKRKLKVLYVHSILTVYTTVLLSGTPI